MTVCPKSGIGATLSPQVGESTLHDLQLLHALARDCDYVAVLRKVASMDAPLGPDHVRLAAMAMLPSLAAGLPDDWPESERSKLWRLLILAPTQEGQPRPLHFAIAAAHSGGDTTALPRSAAVLRDTLDQLWDTAPEDPGVLLMVLLLRSHLPGWRDQVAITQRHLALLATFAVQDLAIAWNWMFDPVSFAANKQDIADLLATTSPEDLVARFRPWQLLRFLWITGSDLPERLITVLPTPETIEDHAALTSLALRDVVLAGGQGSERLEDLRLAELARAWGGLRVAVPESALLANGRLAARPYQALNAALRLTRTMVPFLHRARRPKVAVCVSGQLRGYRAALPSWKYLLHGAETRFFVHVWEAVGRSGAEPFRAYLPFDGPAFCAAWRDVAHRSGMPEMQARYPTLFANLAKGDVVTATEIGAWYDTEDVIVEDDRSESFAGWSNSRKMHHKLAAAQALVGAHAGDFDLVLRIRPDKELGLAAFAWADLQAAAAAPAIFADIPMGHHYGNIMIGDQVAMGLPAVMQVYADTATRVPELADAGLYGWPPECLGHVSLAATCWHAGIAVRRLPVKMGRLLESSAMPRAEILAALSADAAGRMDRMDCALITAARSHEGG